MASIALAPSLSLLAAVDFQPAGGNRPMQLWALKVSFAGISALCYAGALLVIRPYALIEERHRHVLRQLATRSA